MKRDLHEQRKNNVHVSITDLSLIKITSLSVHHMQQFDYLKATLRKDPKTLCPKFPGPATMGETVQSCSLYLQFRYASKRDILFMILGTICASIHGTAFPLMIVVFGEMVDLFVNSGLFEYAVEQMVTLGILASLSLSKEDVIADPDLLQYVLYI